jgi:talin
LTGQGDETDHHAVGAAVNTISSNLPEMAKGVKMLAALMDDEGANGDDLMMAAKQVTNMQTNFYPIFL